LSQADPVTSALADLEASLARDAADPADLLTDLDARLRAVSAALGPKRKAKAIAAADARMVAAREALRTKGIGALNEAREAVIEYRKAHGLPPPAKPRKRFGLAAALEDIPPPPSVCRKLEWEVGRPPMVIGPPGAGKTYAIQAAALDLIRGRPLWACPDFRVPGPCHVLHVDLDQGVPKTLRRYQRLLRGLGVTAKDLATALAQLAGEHSRAGELGRLEVDSGEGLVLTSLQPEEVARWFAAWVEALRGFDVVFVDSLRRLAPFLDENDSRFSIVPDTMRAISERARCVIVLLHHASNKARGGAPGQPKVTAGTRGTSAIDGAAGTQLMVEEDGDARRVTMIRAGEAAKVPPFYFAFNDVEHEGGLRGLRIVYQTSEEARAPEKAEKAAKIRRIADRVWIHVREVNVKKGIGVPGRRAICNDVDGRDASIYAAIQLLVDDGLLRETEEKQGGKKVQRIWAVDPRKEGGE